MRSMILVAVMSLSLTGCAIFERHIYIESRRPIIPTPATEQLALLPSDEELFTEEGDVVDPQALQTAYIDATENLAILLHENEVLLDLIEKYNELSRRKNIDNGFTLPDSTE